MTIQTCASLSGRSIQEKSRGYKRTIFLWRSAAYTVVQSGNQTEQSISTQQTATALQLLVKLRLLSYFIGYQIVGEFFKSFRHTRAVKYCQFVFDSLSRLSSDNSNQRHISTFSVTFLL